MSYLVRVVTGRDALVKLALCDALCRCGEQFQRMQHIAYDNMTEYVHQYQADDGECKDIVQQVVVLAIDVLLGIDDAHVPVERLHGATLHGKSCKGLVEDKLLGAVHYEWSVARLAPEHGVCGFLQTVLRLVFLLREDGLVEQFAGVRVNDIRTVAVKQDAV